VPPPGAAREDWKIIRAVSEVMKHPLPYDELSSLRERMWDVSPTLLRYDTVETPGDGTVQIGLSELIKQSARAMKEKVTGGRTGAFKKPIEDFYRTDSISRSSVTMAQCSKVCYVLSVMICVVAYLIVCRLSQDTSGLQAMLTKIYPWPLSVRWIVCECFCFKGRHNNMYISPAAWRDL